MSRRRKYHIGGHSVYDIMSLLDITEMTAYRKLKGELSDFMLKELILMGIAWDLSWEEIIHDIQENREKK